MNSTHSRLRGWSTAALMLLLTSYNAWADNPIVRYTYTADRATVVFGDTCFV